MGWIISISFLDLEGNVLLTETFASDKSGLPITLIMRSTRRMEKLNPNWNSMQVVTRKVV